MKTKMRRIRTKSDLPLFVKKKLCRIETEYFLNDPPSCVDINAPRALMQSAGNGRVDGINWMLDQPLYSAALDLLSAAKDALEYLNHNICPELTNHHRISHIRKKLEDVIAKGEGKC